MYSESSLMYRTSRDVTMILTWVEAEGIPKPRTLLFGRRPTDLRLTLL